MFNTTNPFRICMLGIAFAFSGFAAVAQIPSADASDQPAVLVQQRFVNPDLDTVKQRVVADLLEPAVDQARINTLVKTLKPDGSWSGIDYKDTTKTGFRHSIHLENMLELARAYRKPTASTYGRADVKQAASMALDFWFAHDFICENWWWNEMGTPNWMINTLLVLDTALTEKQQQAGLKIASRASLTGFGARAGGDFVPIAGMVCKQALFKDDEAMLLNGMKVMADQIHVTLDRGIKPDMSFHHRVDHVISIHTYGTSYVSSFAYWMVKTAGTKYKLPETGLKLLVDYYLDGVSKAMSFGRYPDPGAKNRDLSRRGSLDAAGTDIPLNFMAATEYRKRELQDLVRVRKGTMAPVLTWDKYFWHSSYFMHQRKDYFASVRMHSSRQNNMEEAYNEEGLKNHHFADGANFISRTGREYVDVFPVWDWQKIPGTTVVQKAALPPFKQIAKKGLSDFVGAVSNGTFGAAAFDFKSVHDPLKAKKSWFFFDREYVCLGAGIGSEANDPVATTLNQTLLHGNVVVRSASGTANLSIGTHRIAAVNWILHDSVGYIFPSADSVTISNTTATGSWRDITHQASASAELVQHDLFTAWLNHGARPVASRYAYIVLPATSRASLEKYDPSKNIRIISNTPALQAVQHTALGITQAVFYQPGQLTMRDKVVLTAVNPCIVMVKMSGDKIVEISVADPTEKLGSIQLNVTAGLVGKGDNVSVVPGKNQSSDVTIKLLQGPMAGKSVVTVFAGK